MGSVQTGTLKNHHRSRVGPSHCPQIWRAVQNVTPNPDWVLPMAPVVSLSWNKTLDLGWFEGWIPKLWLKPVVTRTLRRVNPAQCKGLGWPLLSEPARLLNQEISHRRAVSGDYWDCHLLSKLQMLLKVQPWWHFSVTPTSPEGPRKHKKCTIRREQFTCVYVFSKRKDKKTP